MPSRASLAALQGWWGRGMNAGGSTMEGATGRIVWLRHRVGATVEGEDRERLAELAEAKV
jgi:hypothetical protein